MTTKDLTDRQQIFSIQGLKTSNQMIENSKEVIISMSDERAKQTKLESKRNSRWLLYFPFYALNTDCISQNLTESCCAITYDLSTLRTT